MRFDIVRFTNRFTSQKNISDIHDPFLNKLIAPSKLNFGFLPNKYLSGSTYQDIFCTALNHHRLYQTDEYNRLPLEKKVLVIKSLELQMENKENNYEYNQNFIILITTFSLLLLCSAGYNLHQQNLLSKKLKEMLKSETHN